MHQPPTLPPTDERFVLHATSPRSMTDLVIQEEHLARYALAVAQAAGRRALDAACGSGYGSPRLLAAGAVAVTALDLAPEAVAFARHHHGRAGVRYVRGDVTALPFADGAFDLLSQLETIEHVPSPAAAIAEASRVLAAGGVYVVSTPNALLTAKDDAGRPTDPYHVEELPPAEFDRLLRAGFREVSLYGQHRVTSGRQRRRRLRDRLQQALGLRGIEALRRLRDGLLGPLAVRLPGALERAREQVRLHPVDVTELGEFLYMVAVCVR